MKTTTTRAPLDQLASIPQLRALLAAGVLEAEESRRLERRVRQELPWARWLNHSLLALGILLIMAGIGYFFAHNWTRISDDAKLGLAGGAVAATFAGAMRAGKESLTGKLLLLAASALVGVFLAVYGQVYQTGAASYELVRAWALLILPWVLLGRFVPLWIFWLGLVNGLIVLWPDFGTDLFWMPGKTFQAEMVTLCAVNGAGLALREWATRAKVLWLDSGWCREVLLTATLLPMTMEASRELFDGSYWTGPSLLVQGGYAALAAGLAWYFYRQRSLPALAIVAVSACWVLTMLVISQIGRVAPGADNMLLMALIILGIFGGAGAMLRAASRRFSQQNQN
jgi:uncharacterized membrane protein